MIPVSVASHDQISHVAPHFNHLDVRNAVVPLISHDQRCHVATYFNCLNLRNAIVPSMLASHYANAVASGDTWPEHSCQTPFWLSWPNKCSDTIDDTTGIMLCQCWCQWHQITKIYFAPHFDCLGVRNVPNGMTWLTKVMLHPISIVLT